MSVRLGQDEILFLTDAANTLGVVKAGKRKSVFIETDDEELVQFLEPDDLIAVSCFYAGEDAKKAIRSMLYLVREGGMPLLVLKKGHPASARLKMVVSAGERITLSSCIVPGTHPEQDVLCGKGSFDSMRLAGTHEGITIEGGGGYEIMREHFPS